MSEAPEKIWVEEFEAAECNTSWAFRKPRGENDIPFIRADIVDELVEALVEMVGWMDSGDEIGSGSPWHNRAKAALRKARGEKDE